MVTMDTTQILTRIDAVKGQLKTTENFEMVQRFITSGEWFLLDSESYFELKSLVASQFGLHHSQVLITGSAKLGFSIAPTKRFRHFRDESNIDVAIISQDFSMPSGKKCLIIGTTVDFGTNNTDFILICSEVGCDQI